MRTILCLLILLTSCCKENAPFNRNRLRMASEVDPQTLDPRLARDLYTKNYLGLTYEGLMRQNEKGELVKGVAEAVEISDDRLTYTFRLKSSRWSDGTGVSANDFVASWNSVIKGEIPSPSAHLLDSIDSVAALDDQTVVVTLKYPDPLFLEITSQLVTAPFIEEGLSNGPYRLVSFETNDKLVLEANPHYVGAQAQPFEEIVTYSIKDGTAIALFEQGDLDWVGSPIGTMPLDFIKPYSDSPNIHFTKGASTYILRLNVDKLPDPISRGAIYHAIDRQAIVDHVRHGAAEVASRFVPDVCWKNPYDWKPVKKEATTEGPLTISYTNLEVNHRLAQVLQQQLQSSLGVEVILERLEGKSLFQNLKSGNYQIAIGSWFADYMDPSNFLSIFESKEGGSNNTGWENSEYSRLLSEAVLSENRELLLQEAEKILITESAIIPLYHSSFISLKREGVDHIDINPLGLLCVY